MLPTRQLKQHVSNMVFFGLLNEDGTVTEPSYVSRFAAILFMLSNGWKMASVFLPGNSYHMLEFLSSVSSYAMSS